MNLTFIVIEIKWSTYYNDVVFGLPGLPKISKEKIKRAVKEAKLLPKKELENVGKDKLTVTLGKQLFAVGKIVKNDQDKNIAYSNLTVIDM